MTNKSVFTIDEVKNSSSPEIIIKNCSTNEFFSILPEYGARLKELWLNSGKKNISILKKINSVDSENRDDIFTNAKLSPFAGRIKDGKFIFNNTEFILPINYPEEGNACHGYVYPKKFIVIEKRINSDGALCRLEYLYDNENKGYPFKYSIELTYELSSAEGIIITTRIVNHSENSIPLSDGWHHYFDLGIRVNDLQLKLDVSKTVELDSRNIPTGNKKAYNDFSVPAKIGNTQFDSCFKIKSNGGKAITKLISRKDDIDLNIWQETGHSKYEYLVIYTPPGRRSIAVEPITSNINSFNNIEGLVVLTPGEKFSASFGIFLNKI
jgi:aldose 1-epimerase